ncbi:MAG: TonB-dependent receptor [Pseudomonadota bacterium]
MLTGVGLGALPALAQESRNATSVLEEIVVTAQKREQSAQDVGIAITTFSGEQMRALGVEQSFDIAAFSPGVHISGNLAGQNTQFTIRGVTQNDFNDIVEAPNAVYLDEGYLAVAQAQTFAVFDIDRVEILKGPQGTLFGRNATGGLVHYISRKPSLEGVEGYVDVTYGRFDSPANANQTRIEAALGGPLGDKLAARGAVYYNWHQGYLKNLYPQGAVGGPPGPDAGANLGTDDTLAGRFTLLAKPSDTLRVSLAFNGARSNLATGPYQSKPTIGVFNADGELVNVVNVAPGETRASILLDGAGNDNGADFGSDLDNDGVFGLNDPDDAFLTARFGAGTDFFGYRDPDGEDFTFSSDFAFKKQGSVDTWGLNGRVEWDLADSILLTAVTDYKNYKKLLFIDVDSAPVNQSANYAAVDATSFTQEIRLNGEVERMRWVAGLYYLNIDTDSDNGLKFPVGSVVPGAPFDLGSDAQLETNSYSVFGQAEYDLAEKLTFILGARLIEEKKKYHFEQNLYFGNTSSRSIHQGAPLLIGPVFGPNGPEPFDDKTGKTLWAGKAQLDWRASDDLLVYFGVNRGVKAGSFNAQLAGGLAVPTSAIPYGAETLLSFEGGFKARLFDGTTRLNGSAFYYDYSDYQAFLFTGVSGVVINADATNKGVELELQTSPLDGLDAVLALAWFDATVKDVPLRVGGPIVRDVRPTYAPEFQLNGLVRYGWPAFGGELALTGDFSYSSSYFYNLRNFDADKFGSYLVLNARLAWASDDDKWELALKVNNITDERVGIQGFDLATLCGCNEISFQPPRWYGLSVRRAL